MCDVNVPVSLYMYRFKVDQQQRDAEKNEWHLYLSVCFPSPSLRVFPRLSLNILFKEGWPSRDKQKEEDPLSSSSNSPLHSIFLSLSSSISRSFSPSLTPSLILKSPSPKNKILLTLLHLLISTI